MQTFGKALETARMNAGLKQNELARLIVKEDGKPITASYLCDLESDKRNPPDDFYLEQFAKILDVPAEYFYFLANRFPPSLRGKTRSKTVDAGRVERAYRAFTRELEKSM